jgi:4-hydroxy-3-methylbut-2-enyl diphosphate reductase
MTELEYCGGEGEMAVTEDRISDCVVVAEHAGFCSGVAGSLLALDRLIERETGRPIYYGEPMVHNEEVMKPFYARGLRKYDGGKVPEGAIFVISAHGAGLAETESLKKRGFEVFDPKQTTCPRVTFFQNEARKMSENGYKIVIFGRLDHPEIKGVVGHIETGRRPVVFATVDQAKNVPIERAGKVAVFCQTTYYKPDFTHVCEILRKKNPNLKIVDTVCLSVTERISAALELAGNVEVMFVLGSKGSSNTLHLVEETGKVVHTELIQSVHDLLGDGTRAVFLRRLIETAQKLGVTAGASTSRGIVDEFVKAAKSIRLAA